MLPDPSARARCGETAVGRDGFPLLGGWTHEQFSELLRIGGGYPTERYTETMMSEDAAHFRRWIEDDSTCCEVARCGETNEPRRYVTKTIQGRTLVVGVGCDQCRQRGYYMGGGGGALRCPYCPVAVACGETNEPKEGK